MATRMLIDARHPEETRVAVLKGNRIEEFDFESAEHKQIKGNIYLAKVTRVEPSLQAAFVDFGGNRHGFLAFSEIHPDYYQIPVADREALMRDEEEAEAESAAAEAEAADEVSEPAPIDSITNRVGRNQRKGFDPGSRRGPRDVTQGEQFEYDVPTPVAEEPTTTTIPEQPTTTTTTINGSATDGAWSRVRPRS